MKSDLTWHGEGVVHVYDADKLRWAIDSGRAVRFFDDRSLPAKIKQKFAGKGREGLWVPKDELDRLNLKPDEELYAGENLIMTSGVTRVWNLFTNQGGTQAADATHTRVGTSDNGGSLALAAGNTDLGGTTNKWFNLVDAASTVSTNTNKWTSTFATGNGNYAWQDWGVDVGNTSSSGTVAALLVNRVVTNLGTKTSAAAWAFSVTLSIS